MLNTRRCALGWCHWLQHIFIHRKYSFITFCYFHRKHEGMSWVPHIYISDTVVERNGCCSTMSFSQKWSFTYNNHNLFVYTKITFDVWFRILAEIPVSLTHLWNVRTKLLYIYKLKDIFYRTWAVLLAFIFLCYSYHGCILLTVRQAKGLLMFAVGLQLWGA